MEIFSSNRSFGGWTKMFSHSSDSCNGIMRCSIYLPPQVDTRQGAEMTGCPIPWGWWIYA